jgi:ribosome-binding factor A
MEPAKRSTTVDREQEEGFYADVLDEAIHDPNDPGVCVVDVAVAKRMTIAYIYVKVLEEPLQFTTDEDDKRKDQWQGKGGVYAQISKILVDMHPVGSQEESGSCSLTKTIQTVLANISMCRKSGVQYEGKINWSGGAKKKTHE